MVVEENQKNMSVASQTTFTNELIFNAIMNNSQDTIYFKDKNSKFILSSKAHANQFELCDLNGTMGKSDFDFFPMEFAQKAFNLEKEIMETGIPALGIIEKWEKKDGTNIWFSASKYPFYNFEGEVIGTWGTSKDITEFKIVEEELARVNRELEEANSRLQELSSKDGLSGLFNQRQFYKILGETISNAAKNQENSKKDKFCVLLIDIDCFKLVNDKYGHYIGDLAIKHVSDVISVNTRSHDRCFRVGGDEFAIIIFETNIKMGIQIAKRICKEIEETRFSPNDKTIKLTASIGISCFRGEKDIGSVIEEVDIALYEAKNNGKNQVRYKQNIN